MAMKGTTLLDTLEMDWIPPRVTSATIRVSTTAVTSRGTEKERLMASERALTCGKVPMAKKAAPMPDRANSLASGLEPSPFSR